MLSIKRIYAFWQTYFCLHSNVNMIASKYNLIEPQSLNAFKNINIDKHPIQGKLSCFEFLDHPTNIGDYFIDRV